MARMKYDELKKKYDEALQELVSMRAIKIGLVNDQKKKQDVIVDLNCEIEAVRKKNNSLNDAMLVLTEDLKTKDATIFELNEIISQNNNRDIGSSAERTAKLQVAADLINQVMYS